MPELLQVTLVEGATVVVTDLGELLACPKDLDPLSSHPRGSAPFLECVLPAVDAGARVAITAEHPTRIAMPVLSRATSSLSFIDSSRRPKIYGCSSAQADVRGFGRVLGSRGLTLEDS